MISGFYNRILYVDLTQRSFKEEHIDDTLYKQFLGGKGLGTYLLLKNNEANVDPLSPDNALVLATGPATDTRVFGSSRYGVFTKSPLTGFYCESYSGGKVAEPLSRTGYDAIVIKGASASPVYLEITSGKVIFHDAQHLWGKDTYQAEDAIRATISRKDIGIVVIGPAGENLVRFAVIENDYWRSAGRCGSGAVLGSKKVKGIVFYGNAVKSVAQPELLKSIWQEIGSKAKTDPGVNAYKNLGTPMMVAILNKVGAFPTKYWSAGTYDQWKKISAETLLSQNKVKPKACPKCFIACGKLTEVTSGRHQGLKIEGPEYETINVFGGQCMIDDLREIAYLNDICDRLGMDTITAGNLAAFAIEVSHRKDIGEKLQYGDVDAIAELLNKISRKNGIGAILAQGIKHAAKEWDLEDLAIHVKGLEPPGYEPRTLQGMGLAYAINDRGACHLRATIYKAELSGLIGFDQVEGKAEMLIDFEDRHTLFDTLILCRFFRDLYQWEQLAQIINGTTGMKVDKKQLQKMSLDITNLARAFSLREGMTSDDDTLPQRYFEEKLEYSGRVISKADFERMRSDYYRIKGWS